MSNLACRKFSFFFSSLCKFSKRSLIYHSENTSCILSWAGRWKINICYVFFASPLFHKNNLRLWITHLLSLNWLLPTAARAWLCFIQTFLLWAAAWARKKCKTRILSASGQPSTTINRQNIRKNEEQFVLLLLLLQRRKKTLGNFFPTHLTRNACFKHARERNSIKTFFVTFLPFSFLPWTLQIFYGSRMKMYSSLSVHSSLWKKRKKITFNVI